jgi:hypothetical protein
VQHIRKITSFGNQEKTLVSLFIIDYVESSTGSARLRHLEMQGTYLLQKNGLASTEIQLHNAEHILMQCKQTKPK